MVCCYAYGERISSKGGLDQFSHYQFLQKSFATCRCHVIRQQLLEYDILLTFVIHQNQAIHLV